MTPAYLLTRSSAFIALAIAVSAHYRTGAD